MNFWDEKFAGPDYKYGTEPNTFLTEQATRLVPASRVLLPGDGEGRNGVWLAQQGHTVTSVDNSVVGLQKARDLAVRRGVALATERVDLADWAPPAGHFDAIVLIYTHLPGSIRQAAHRRLAQGLKTGGWVILEAFHPAQLAHATGGPKDEDMLYSPELLSADFAELLTPVLAWHVETHLSEGAGHSGLAHVTRWIGQKI